MSMRKILLLVSLIRFPLLQAPTDVMEAVEFKDLTPEEKEPCRAYRGNDDTDGENGEDAPDIDIYIQQTTHAVTGATLYRVWVVPSNGKPAKGYIFEDGYKLSLKSVGGKGGNGGAGGKGSDINSSCAYSLDRGKQGNGGNGGDIRIIKNTDAFDYSHVLSVVTRGGQPGEGGAGTVKGTKGSYGKEGKISIRVDPSLEVTFEK